MLSQGWYKGQRDDYDQGLGHNYDNGFNLDHMENINTSNSHDGD